MWVRQQAGSVNVAVSDQTYAGNHRNVTEAKTDRTGFQAAQRAGMNSTISAEFVEKILLEAFRLTGSLFYGLIAHTFESSQRGGGTLLQHGPWHTN